METKVEFECDRPKFISYYEHEAEIARSEVHSKRWMIAAIIAFAALIITNGGWIVHESLYQDVVTETYSADSGSGGVAISNREGGVSYGESDVQQDQGSR